MEFPTGKKLFHLVVNPGTSLCPTVDPELVQTTRNVNGTRDSVRKFQSGKRPGGGGVLGYFLGGYVPPGTPNWYPVLEKISPKIDTPF